MKKIILLISSIIFAFSMTTCESEKMDFDTNGGKGLSFVHFVGTTQTIAAKANAYTATITVSSTEKSNAARTYNLVIDPASTAKEGIHYTLSSKTVTIPAGQFGASVTLTADLKNLTPQTVTAKFSIDSDEAIDYGKTMTVNMYLFFEVTIDWLVGTWLWTDYEDGEIDDQYPVEIEKIDDKTISITNIWDGEETVEATVEFNNARISIKPNQQIWTYQGIPVHMLSYSSVASKTDPIYGNCSYTGSISIEKWAPVLDDGRWFGLIYTSKLTRP